jgi:hypothetical protein
MGMSRSDWWFISAIHGPGGMEPRNSTRTSATHREMPMVAVAIA